MTTLDGLLNGIDLTLFCAKKSQVNSVQDRRKTRERLCWMPLWKAVIWLGLSAVVGDILLGKKIFYL